ncbi:hypothetical protein RB653_002378 [Dictyostelium firmibasis]|uniref:Uncharacterized protein n=1 Tax=Dictyostelium firmibasis TaxID=79012 RepID=A0AAN7TWC5_9MYCE
MYKNENSIFVSIISYRDSECQWTIKNLIELAKNSENIFIGVCLQYSMKDDRDNECFQYKFEDTEYGKKHIRTIRMDYSEAKGPCYARALVQQQLYNGEKYYLQIDSHMRFVKDWDTEMINQLLQCKTSDSDDTVVDEKAILTCYPMGYKLPNVIPVHRFPILLVATEFGKNDGFLRIGGKIVSKKLTRPCPSLFWVSGFSFSRSHIIADVPYDPNLQYLFFGEEISMSARLFTHGYNFYSPTKTLIFHLWNRDYRSTFRENKSIEIEELENKSKQRLSILLNNNNNNNFSNNEIEPKYNLGNIKSLDDYSNYCGVDFKNKTINNKGKFGGYYEERDIFFMNEIMEYVIKSQIGI